MAIYHFTCKYVSRAGATDKNSVRSAAYCAGKELSDLNTGSTFNFSNKKEVVFSEIQAPANAPEWVADRQRLWSEVEKKEIRYDAKLMSQFEASLPNELDLEQAKALMYDFSSASLVKRGMVSDWSVHWVLHNKHVHVNTTTREISGEGFGKKVREWEEKKTLYALRKEWAECVNKHLSMAGFDVRIDHRSFKDQGIDHEPTVHVGPERSNNKEVVSERKARNRRTRNRNRIVDADNKVDATIKQLEADIKTNEDNLVKVVAREKKTVLTKRMVNSLPKPITKPAIELSIEPIPSVARNTSLAPADLFDNVLNKHFSQQKPKRREPPVAIHHGCWELRLPNGKNIIPRSFHALETTIAAWGLSEIEAAKLKTKFWQLSSPEYYNYYLTNVFALNESKFDDSIFVKYNKKYLDDLKESGLSPVEIIEQSLKGDKLKTSIGYYYKQVCACLKQKSHLGPVNISPFDLCYGYQNKQPIADIANKAISRNKAYSIPNELTALMNNKTSAAHYDILVNYCSMNGMNDFQTNKFMEIWWEQVTFDEYHQEVRNIALQQNKTMNLDMIPVDRIREQYNYRLSPAECLENLSGGSGGGTGFIPTPGPLQPSNTPQPRTPWSTLTTGTRYGGFNPS